MAAGTTTMARSIPGQPATKRRRRQQARWKVHPSGGDEHETEVDDAPDDENDGHVQPSRPAQPAAEEGRQSAHDAELDGHPQGDGWHERRHPRDRGGHEGRGDADRGRPARREKKRPRQDRQVHRQEDVAEVQRVEDRGQHESQRGHDGGSADGTEIEGRARAATAASVVSIRRPR